MWPWRSELALTRSNAKPIPALDRTGRNADNAVFNKRGAHAILETQSMARFTSVLKLAMPVAALAFLLSGCEDLDARSQTAAVSKQLDELKAQVSDLKARNEDNTQKL